MWMVIFTPFRNTYAISASVRALSHESHRLAFFLLFQEYICDFCVGVLHRLAPPQMTGLYSAPLFPLHRRFQLHFVKSSAPRCDTLGAFMPHRVPTIANSNQTQRNKEHKPSSIRSSSPSAGTGWGGISSSWVRLEIKIEGVVCCRL